MEPPPPSNLIVEPPEVTCSCPLVWPACIAGGKLFRAAATAAAADMDAFDAEGDEGDVMEAARGTVITSLKDFPLSQIAKHYLP